MEKRTPPNTVDTKTGNYLEISRTDAKAGSSIHTIWLCFFNLSANTTPFSKCRHYTGNARRAALLQADAAGNSLRGAWRPGHLHLPARGGHNHHHHHHSQAAHNWRLCKLNFFFRKWRYLLFTTIQFAIEIGRGSKMLKMPYIHYIQ
jgi:hypothetical protein